MPDQINKQSLINLLIDSPLREPIKINLIDIVNNTSDVDLPKVYPTITKELEIFQKATDRRLKLAEETISKLGGATTPPSPETTAPTEVPAPAEPAPTPSPPLSVPPLDLPPLPTSPTPLEQIGDIEPTPTAPATPTVEPASPLPPPQPLGTTTDPSSTDEDALAEIQKELDSLKTETKAEITPQEPEATSAPAETPQPPQS